MVCVGARRHSIMLCYLYCYQALWVDSEENKKTTTKWTVVEREGRPGRGGVCVCQGLARLAVSRQRFCRLGSCYSREVILADVTSLPPAFCPLPSTRNASRTRCAWTRAPCEQSTRCDHVEDAREWWGKRGREGAKGRQQEGSMVDSLNWSWPVAASHFDAFSSRELNLVYRKMQRRKEQVEEAETVGSQGGEWARSSRGRAAEAKAPNVSNRNFIVPLVRPSFWCLLYKYMWYMA